MGGLPVGSVPGLSPGNAASTGTAKLSVVPAFRDGQLRTQSVLNPYTKRSVDHVTLKLYTVAGGQESPVLQDGSPVEADLASGSLDAPVTFDHLHNDTTYRVKALAYRAPGQASADLISTEDASSSVDVAIGRDVSPALERVPVKLIDRLFAAKGTTSLAITDGSYTYLNETITLAPTPAPAPLTYTITGTRATWWSVDGGQTTYTTSHGFNPTLDVTTLATASIRGLTYYVQPTAFVNATTDNIRVDDGNGFNAEGSWSGHYLGLLPGATGSLNLVVSVDNGNILSYSIYYP